MNRVAAALVFASLTLTPTLTLAKVTSCEADLNLVRRMIDENHVELPVHHQMLFVMTYPVGDLRSRKAARIFESVVNQKCLSAAAFINSGEAVREVCGDVVRTRAQFKDKRILARYETVRFLMIDTVEGFIDDLTPPEREANFNQLRQLISTRVREGRPTLLVFADETNAQTYLPKLADAPKSTASSVRK